MPVLPALLTFLLSLLVLAPAARAGELLDLVTTPFDDPLFAYPPRIDIARGMPDGLDDAGCIAELAQDSKVLTLQQAVLLSLCNNPQIHSAMAGIHAQAAQVGSARAAYLPTLNAGASRTNQKSTYPEARFQVNSDVTTESQYATLTWRLLDFGGRDANRRAANALLVGALASHRAALQKTLSHVVGAYFDAQTAKATQDAKEKGVVLARQTLAAAERREVRGAGARTDTLQARTALAKAELERSRAVGLYQKTLAALVAAMGVPAQSPVMREFALAPPEMSAPLKEMADRTLADWLVLAQSDHPALIASRAQLLAAKEKLGAARSEAMPTLDFTHSRYINGRPNQGVSSSQSREAVTGLSLNIPLFDGFSSTYKIRGAQAQVEAREAEVRDTENQILSEIVKAHADALAALRAMDSSLLLVDAATEALGSVQIKYGRGVADIMDMLNVQMALADAEQERIRAMADWSSARLRLLSTAGIAGIRDMAAAGL